ncbi:MAG: DUF2058 domain-containing protein [Agarilytica sp.]
MKKSLQDQLLNAGLIDKKRAKKIGKESKKEKAQKVRSQDVGPNEEQAALLKARQEKIDRDRALNKQRDLELEKKAISAQIIQLIQHYKIDIKEGDVEYNFSDDGKVKKLRVTTVFREEIVRGKLCVARAGQSYVLIPKPIADKIKERDESVVVVANSKVGEKEDSLTDEDEAYYANFEIPDDLMW